MQDSDGFHAAPVLRDRADADERTGDVVDADGGAALAARGCPDLDRLAVPERDGRALVEGHPSPARQGRFRRRDARPEHCRLGADDVGPGDRVGEVEGADTTPDEALDGAAVAERGPQVGGEHAHGSARAADDTEGSPKRTVATYSLSWSMRYGVSLVASPIRTGRTPVAAGSSVPA